MSSNTSYRIFPLADAKRIAEDKLKKIAVHSEIALIAGSIRREKYEIGDIEIVCVPKKQKIGNVDLWGNDTRQTIVAVDFTETVNQLGKVLKGSPHGRMMQIELTERIVLDLFMPMPYDFWRIFAIRTGSRDYSQQKIAKGWLKVGWCGTADGLRLQKECDCVTVDGKTKWTVKKDIKEPILPPVWGSEKEFFDFINVQYLPPKMRFV